MDVKVRCKYRIINDSGPPGCNTKDCKILSSGKDIGIVLGRSCTILFEQVAPFNSNSFYVYWTTYILNKEHLIEIKDE